MKIVDRIKARTPMSHKRKGKIATAIGIACATILTLGVVTAPIGIAILSVGAAVFGGKAVYHAQKKL
jgi:hypothetical protein